MKRTAFKSKPHKVKKRKATPKLEPWVRAVPESTSHGSGTLQKRLWRLTSDAVRIRDWYNFRGECVATGNKISNWRDGDAGHWKSYAVCRGLFKFHLSNIHLQSKTSNGWGGQELGHSFGENLKKRYGEGMLEHINSENKLHSLKFTTEEIKQEMISRLELLAVLPEQPEYFKRVQELLKTL